MQVHTVATKRRRNRLVTALNENHPTPERMRHAGGDYELGDDRQGTKVLTMRDSPLERARHRKQANGQPVLTEAQYNAAVKYRHHRYRAGLAACLSSADLNGVFGGFGSRTLFASEGASHHLGECIKARKELKPLHAAMLEAIVSEEKALAQIGRDLGWKSESKAIEAVEGILRDSLQKLVRLWGL